MARTSFTVGWWARFQTEYVATNVISFSVYVNGSEVARVRISPLDSTNNVGTYEIRLQAGGVTTNVTGTDASTAPPRTNWPSFRFQLRVQCGTYASGVYTADGTAELLKNGTSIISTSALSIPQYATNGAITLDHGALIDTSRVWLKNGVAAVTVDANGLPSDISSLIYYDDFSSGLGSWTAWNSYTSGGTAVLPTLFTTGGAADGPCISCYANAPSNVTTGAYNAFQGITRTATLPLGDPGGGGSPPPPVTYLGSPIKICTPQTTVSSPAHNAGCSDNGVGYTPTYLGASGAMPVGADPIDGERLTGKRALNMWAELTHTNY